MLDLTIRPEAERDIKDIWRYTRRTWSREQADRYVATLRAAIEELAARPDRGRACDAVSPGLFRRNAERHVIFFRLGVGSLLVVRVLHESMDHTAHLANDDA